MSALIRRKMLDLTMNLVGRWVYKQNGIGEGIEKLSNAARSIKIRNHRIRYFDVGKGKPVLLLHGLGSSSFSWLPTMISPIEGRRFIAVDQIGHGRSDKPLLKYRITDFVDYLEAFIDELQLGSVDLVGNSLGGWISARLAVKRPDLVKSLALVCSAGLQPSPLLRERLEKVKFAARSYDDTRTMLELCFYDKQRYASKRSTAVTFMLRRLESSYTTVERVLDSVYDPEEWMDEKMDKVRARTLILWGRRDELLPVEFAERFASGISGSRLEIFEDCGHVPQIERANDFNRLISDFLS